MNASSERRVARKHESVQEMPTLRQFLVLIFFLIFSWLAVAWYPVQRLDAQPVERMLAENDTRAAMIQLIGLLGLGLTIYMTYRRVVASELQVKELREQTGVAERTQVTDRFIRATKLLGATDSAGRISFEQRLGAIYSLEQIAIEAEDYHWNVVEVLSAYVRQNRPHRAGDVTEDGELAQDKSAADSQEICWIGPDPSTPPLRIDIQAVLTVLGRRRAQRDGDRRIDLSATNLDGVYLPRANLTNAKFDRASLQHATLEDADLGKASFLGADLSHCNLKSARMNGANLVSAKLLGADCREAEMRGIRAANSYCRQAQMNGAALVGAVFDQANLEYAQLGKCDGSGASFVMAWMEQTSLRHSRFTGAVFAGAIMTKTGLDHSDFRGACFSTARLEQVGFVRADLRGADLGWALLDPMTYEHECVYEGTRLEGARLERLRVEPEVLTHLKLDGVAISSLPEDIRNEYLRILDAERNENSGS